MNYSTWYHIFPTTFHVVSQKIDYLWDSVHYKYVPHTLDHFILCRRQIYLIPFTELNKKLEAELTAILYTATSCNTLYTLTGGPTMLSSDIYILVPIA